MFTRTTQIQGKPHPYIPQWGLCSLPIIKIAVEGPIEEPINISRERAVEVQREVYKAIQNIPSQMLIGLDLRQVALMPSFLWRQIGPLLHNQVIEGALGPDKRILFLTGGDEDTIRMLNWAFQDASREASTRAGKSIDRAALVPAAAKGYCGILRLAYEEVFSLINSNGVLSNEMVVQLVNDRYSLNNANNYLTALADLGLIYRQITARSSGGYLSQAYALNVAEEIFNDANCLV